MIKKILLSSTILSSCLSVSIASSAVSSAPAPLVVTACNDSKVLDYSSVVEKLLPSSVSIIATTTAESMKSQDPEEEGPFGGRSPFDDFFKDFFKNYSDKFRRPQKALGSGFIVKADSNSVYVATNYHVVKGAQKITIVFHDKSELSGEIKGCDERTDIAVIKVPIKESKKTYTPVQFGDSTKLKPGNWVIAIGNPFGLGSSATFGPISSIGRDIMLPSSGSKKVNPYDIDFIQHQAPINVGNSGGMLATLEGFVIGINTAIYTPTGGNVGVGFSIPGYLVVKTINQLIEHGKTKRGWIGVMIQPMTNEMAECYQLEKLGMADKKCVIVSGVTPKGPSEKAGLKEGDIVFEYNGVPLNESNKISRLVAETEVGKKVPIKIIRNRKEMVLDITIEEYETSPIAVENSKKGNGAIIDKSKINAFGITVGSIPEDERGRLKVPEGHEGVYITKVDYQKEISLLPGDVLRSCIITEGDIETVMIFKTLKDVEVAIKTIKEKNLPKVCFRVARDIDGAGKLSEIYLVVSTEEDKVLEKAEENKKESPTILEKGKVEKESKK